MSKVSERISPDSRQKPLPSPPIVQITNPTSPVKSVRGIIDAKEKPLRQSPGTPNEQDWPTLSPERPHIAEGSNVVDRGERKRNGSPEPRHISSTGQGKANVNDERNESPVMVQASERNDTFKRVKPDSEISDYTPTGKAPGVSTCYVSSQRTPSFYKGSC